MYVCMYVYIYIYIYVCVCVYVCMYVCMYFITLSPRAQGVLFTFSRPKGLKVVSSVEISADFENPFLKTICVERFSEIKLKVGYPHFELWPFCKSEN